MLIKWGSEGPQGLGLNNHILKKKVKNQLRIKSEKAEARNQRQLWDINRKATYSSVKLNKSIKNEVILSLFEKEIK